MIAFENLVKYAYYIVHSKKYNYYTVGLLMYKGENEGDAKILLMGHSVVSSIKNMEFLERIVMPEDK